MMAEVHNVGDMVKSEDVMEMIKVGDGVEADIQKASHHPRGVHAFRKDHGAGPRSRRRRSEVISPFVRT